MVSKTRSLFLAVAMLLPLGMQLKAGHHGCGHCGCECECKPVTCKVICEMKEITKVTWGYKCEDHCIPGKSTMVVNTCGCGHCDKCKTVSWIPGCAEVRTKVVPVKHETKIKKPVYKWVVVDLCPRCAQTQAACNQETVAK